jgi:membrane-bound ClpP family serine protease
MTFLFFAIIMAVIVLYLLNSIKILGERERGVIFRLGRVLPDAKGPGIVVVFAPLDRMARVSLEHTGGEHGMVGEIGMAQTALSPRGKVVVRRELWDAVSSAPVAAGQSVMVRKIDGFELRVDPAPAITASAPVS